MERMGDTLAEKLLRSIAASKTRPLSRLLYALGIRHVGRNTARKAATRNVPPTRIRIFRTRSGLMRTSRIPCYTGHRLLCID